MPFMFYKVVIQPICVLPQTIHLVFSDHAFAAMTALSIIIAQTISIHLAFKHSAEQS